MGLALGVVLLAQLAGYASLFVWPHGTTPTRADAVVAFSGDLGDRLERSLQLMRAHVAPVLVLTNGTTTEWPAEASKLCTTLQPFEVLCPRLEPPFNTRSEARTIARVARQRRWRRVAMVTTTYHVTRARLLLSRCYRGRIDTAPSVARGGRINARSIWREAVAVVFYSLVERSC